MDLTKRIEETKKLLDEVRIRADQSAKAHQKQAQEGLVLSIRLEELEKLQAEMKAGETVNTEPDGVTT